MIDQLRALPLGASPGLVRALADARLATALRVMHARPDHDWTVRALAGEAALSRSTFFERFNRAMGIAPMEYLLAWRMALAKDLRGRRERRELSITSVPLHSRRNPPERDAPG
jgi:transcriptional regulator GlxA family with amidase domain